jgi:hypothetical protein
MSFNTVKDNWGTNTQSVNEVGIVKIFAHILKATSEFPKGSIWHSPFLESGDKNRKTLDMDYIPPTSDQEIVDDFKRKPRTFTGV